MAGWDKVDLVFVWNLSHLWCFLACFMHILVVCSLCLALKSKKSTISQQPPLDCQSSQQQGPSAGWRQGAWPGQACCQIKCFWFGLQLQRSLLRLTPWSHDIGGLFFGSLFLLNNPTVYNGGLFKYHKMILIPHKPLN